MKKLIMYLKPYIPRMSLGLFIKFIGTIMDLLLPWILAYMLDYIVPLESVSLVIWWGVGMIISSIVAIAGNVIANIMATKVARDTTERIRHDLYVKISNLSSQQVDEVTIPTLVARLSSDTYNVHSMIGMMQRMGVRAPILLLGGIIVTLTLDPVLSLVLLSVLPLITLVIYIVSKKGIPLYQQLQANVDKMIRLVRENITGIRIIKALSKTNYEKERFEEMNHSVVAREKKVGIVMSITNPSMNLFLNLGLAFVIIVGAYRVNGGLTQPGKIIAFLTYFTIILNAMLTISRIFVVVSKGTASFQRIAEILDIEEDLTVCKEDSILSPYHISFDKVSFSYHKKTNNLTDISFNLKKGETLGIIGATGSGKSTIIKLLMRFYDVDTGSIRIDGHNIKSIPKEILYTKFGVVFQNDVIFADQIAENIDFGRGLTKEEMQFAGEHAQALEFITSLEKQWEHKLTVRGSNLSGGQRQRILISRALLGNPEILILDDASSALDYRTDANLRKSLYENYKDTTKVIVAQRISSIMHADHILVLEEGQILGYGTHEALLKECESYQEISKSQLGGQQHA